MTFLSQVQVLQSHELNAPKYNPWGYSDACVIFLSHFGFKLGQIQDPPPHPTSITWVDPELRGLPSCQPLAQRGCEPLHPGLFLVLCPPTTLGQQILHVHVAGPRHSDVRQTLFWMFPCGCLGVRLTCESADGPPQRGWASSHHLKAGLEQKPELHRGKRISVALPWASGLLAHHEDCGLAKPSQL